MSLQTFQMHALDARSSNITSICEDKHAGLQHVLFLHLIIFGISAERTKFPPRLHENKPTVWAISLTAKCLALTNSYVSLLGHHRVFGMGAFDVKLPVDEMWIVFIQLLQR